MDTATKDDLAREFRAYLDQAPAPKDTPPPTSGTTDLFSLFTELAALKNEVKLESRQVKSALDGFQQLFATLEGNNQRLARELDQRREAQAEIRREAERELLLEILDLRDRLEAAIGAIHDYRPSWWARSSKRGGRFMASLQEGLEITLRRLDQLLVRHRVKAMDALGSVLDPHTMRADHVERHDDRPDGVVLSELRKGFLRDGGMLRLAEVVVNKRTEQT